MHNIRPLDIDSNKLSRKKNAIFFLFFHSIIYPFRIKLSMFLQFFHSFSTFKSILIEIENSIVCYIDYLIKIMQKGSPFKSNSIRFAYLWTHLGILSFNTHSDGACFYLLTHVILFHHFDMLHFSFFFAFFNRN